jgi:glycosyltransferase involved in cell wall biosynthesis
MTTVATAGKFKVFFNHTANSGVVYYRMINPAKYMRKDANVDVAYSYFYPNSQMIADWELKLSSPANQDMIIEDLNMLMKTSDISVWQILHNKISLSLFNSYRKLLPKKKILLEVDDWIFGVNPESMAYETYNPNSDIEFVIERQMINSNGIIASTSYLNKAMKDMWEQFKKNRKQFVEKWNTTKGDYKQGRALVNIEGEKRIETIENAIDFELYDKCENKSNNKMLRIGWAGGDAHGRDLKILENVILEILHKHKNVEFCFFGMRPPFLEYNPRIIHHSSWVGIDRYPEELAKLGFDIGVAPLKDNIFNRCKSNLRWLEYSALGIPTVASNVQPFKETLAKHPDSILIADSEQDWVNALDSLITKENKRKSLGKFAYNTVKCYYNVEQRAKEYIKLLQDIDKDESLNFGNIYS